MSLLQERVFEITKARQQEFTELTLVEEKLADILFNAQGIIKETAVNLSFGGKKIRPFLTIQSGLCFGTLNLDMIDTAVASELIHLASLIHDDVIDKSSTRRGQDTVNARHGNHIAVLAGDYIFAQAFAILASRQILSSMEYLTHAIKEMCEGEVNQADHHFAYIEQEKYFRHIGKKTSTLLAACCKSGAAVAGASPDDISRMGEYGYYLGYVYQIIDDILDLIGDPLTLGKPTGLDLANGNITLPVLLLLENPIYSTWLKNLIETRSITPQGMESVKAALFSTGSIQKTYGLAKEYVEKAKASLQPIPSGYPKNMLLDLADHALTRLN